MKRLDIELVRGQHLPLTTFQDPELTTIRRTNSDQHFVATYFRRTVVPVMQPCIRAYDCEIIEAPCHVWECTFEAGSQVKTETYFLPMSSEYLNCLTEWNLLSK